MTNELIQNGIDAIKDLNDLILKWATEGFNEKEGLMAQKDLEKITDIVQESFLDMIKVDAMREQIKTMNQTLDAHLNRFID
jgi:hypothetical protein